MRREENFSYLDEFDFRILRFIYQVLYHPTRKDIETFFFPHGPKKTRYLERKLQYLAEHKLIGYHLLETKSSPVKERGYYLLIKGSRAIGVELKRNDYKVKRQPEVKKAITDLTILAYRNNWQISANEETARSVLIEHIQNVLRSEGRGVDIKNLIGLLPEKVMPDLVLKTNTSTYVCIVSHPGGEEGYFRRRDEKYESCKKFFKFIVIALSERQWRSAVHALKENCSYLSEVQKFDMSRTYFIFRLSEISQIMNYI